VEQALALREDFVRKRIFQVCVPALCVCELVNGFVTATRRNRISYSDAAGGLRRTLSLGIEEKRPDAERVHALAQEYGLTAYDAAYLALAESEDADLWTGDRRLFEAVSGRSRRMKYVGDYPLGEDPAEG
jgi:predicted nucleic acid-binding protein